MDGSIFMPGVADRMEYRVIRKVANDLESGVNSMENLVNRVLAEGWQLAGGLGVTTHGDEYMLTQAVQRVRPMFGNNRTTFMPYANVADLRPSNNVNRMHG